MKEFVLEYIIKVFAYISILNKEGFAHITRFFVQNYLKSQYSKPIIEKYLNIYDTELKKIEAKKGLREKKQHSLISVKLLKICEVLNNELKINERILIILKFIELIKYSEVVSIKNTDSGQSISDIIFTLARSLKIDPFDYIQCKNFVFDNYSDTDDQSNFIVVSAESKPNNSANHIHEKNLHGKLLFLWINTIKTFLFKYEGNDILNLNGQPVFSKYIYVLPTGSGIKGNTIEPIYYNDLLNMFIFPFRETEIELNVDEIYYTFKKSSNGIQKFSFSASSGELIGIIGASGTGKSTLLNMLSGRKRPALGTIEFNGKNLYKDSKELNGLIGFVPQDDQLIENLSVYQNLYFNAKLCFAHLEESEITALIVQVMHNLDLFKIKDLMVGDSFEKIISGGERKRLNLALELIREPPVLMLDEPTSGLSSKDAEKIMDLLKEQVLKGKLVILSIHQPSSELFKLLNKIIILDRGGYPIYYGEPLEVIAYLKKSLGFVTHEEVECITCGNINPEQIFNYIETNSINEFGEQSGLRINSPKQWYDKFREEANKISISNNIRKDLNFNLSIPGKFKQFKLFFARGLKTKLANKSYIISSLLISPILAFILSFISRYRPIHHRGEPYTLYENENLIIYIFMSMIVAIFVGLIVSAEEFFGDRKTRERERFLNFNTICYINSRLLFLFILSVIQAALFVIVGNLILQIKGMHFYYFIILLSVFVFSNLLGLLISSWFKSIVTIYILIPLLIIPQLLLGGAIISFDKVNEKLTSQEYVPVIADFMASRWAYEAMLVAQFRNNDYQKYYFDIEQKLSNTYYSSAILIPELIKKLKQNEKNSYTDTNLYNATIRFVKNEFAKLPLSEKLDTEYESFNRNTSNDLKSKLNQLSDLYIIVLADLKIKKDSIYTELVDKSGNYATLSSLRLNSYNKKLADYMLNNNSYTKIVEYKGRFIRKFEPVYQLPKSRNGRAHFLAASKNILGISISTPLFNCIIIWLMSAIIYVILIVTLPRITIKNY